MTKAIDCNELGIRDCDFRASGETAGDVVAQVVVHLREMHNIDMPDAEVIMEGKATDDPLTSADPGVPLVVERLIEALNIVPLEEPELEAPKAPIPRAATGLT